MSEISSGNKVIQNRLKIISISLLLIGAGFFFGVVSRQIGKNAYQLIFFPSKDHFVLLLSFLLALTGILVSSGLVAGLLRPAWIAFLSFVLSGIAMLLGGQVTVINFILISVYIVAGTVYTLGVAKELDLLIKFSVKAVSSGQGILRMALILVACGSLYGSYAARIQREGFVLPEPYIEMFMEQVERRIEVQGSKEESQESVDDVDKFREEFRGSIDEFFENTVKPYERFIPLVLAISLFMPLLTITQLLSWVSTIIMQGVFALLTALGITKIISEKRKVERLVIA